MSYIYEALKRAEDENARGVAASTRVRRRPFFATSSRAWLWVLIGVLAANAAGLITLTLVRRSHPPSAPLTTTAEPVAQPAVSPPQGSGAADITPSAPPAITTARPAIAHTKPIVPPPARPAPAEPRADSARATPTAVAPDTLSLRPEAPAPIAPVVPPPAIAPAAVTPGPLAIDISKLHVQVVVYSEIPTERMVIIDGRRYAEGQKLDAETVVESITPNGAVVSRQGQRVTLTSGRP